MKHQRMLELPQMELLVTPLKAPTISTKIVFSTDFFRNQVATLVATLNIPHYKVATKQR